MCQSENLKQGTTVRACFRCVGRVYKHHFPTRIRRFVEQPLLEVTSSRIQNTLAEMTVLNEFVPPLIEEVFSLVLDVFMLALHSQ